MKENIKGFTLIELMIFVVIIGILASLAINSFRSASDRARLSGTAVCIKAWIEGAEAYYAETGSYPEDSGSGERPSFDEYIDTELWDRGPEFGGVWDVGFEERGIISALGVHFYGPNKDTRYNDPDKMVLLDQLIDDGDLETGFFRQFDSDRYLLDYSRVNYLIGPTKMHLKRL
ncbi:MAG: type IV pilin protein [Candidatus Zixiibacteriota bacterium]